MSDKTAADPFRETIQIARGPNTDGQHHQAVAAQADEATRRELAMRAEEDAARAEAVTGIEVGEGNEEGITMQDNHLESPATNLMLGGANPLEG